MPICYNKDKSGNPLKIKENRTCPYSFSNQLQRMKQDSAARMENFMKDVLNL